MVAFRRTLAAFAAATAVASLTLGGMGGRADAASSTFTTPAYAGDFPDPSLLLVDGTYWAYSTGSAGRNLQVMSSPDMKTWTQPRDPLPGLPLWADGGHTWAPGVMRINGVFVMYYSVRDAALSTQCISLATSTSPAGPFVDDSSGPLICQTAHGGSIDPNPYLDPVSNNRYLVWKSDDNSIGQRTHLWAQRLSANGLSLAAGTSPTLLLTQSALWQSPAVEGPTIIRSGGVYYLFYGANSYNSANSGIGYATSRSLLGTYTNQSRYRPWLATTGHATGPQGPMVFTDALGATRMAFAAWYGVAGYQNGGVRALWIGTLGFNRYGTPALS